MRRFVMSEGTKIGEYKDNTEFKRAVKGETAVEEENLKATKMGDMSDFEKSLYESEKDQSKKENESEETPSKSKETLSESQEPENFENMFEQAMDSPFIDYAEGDIIEGVVRSAEKGGILVDFNYKSDGYISNSDSASLDETLSPGDTILVFIEKLESKEGYAILSRKKAMIEETWKDILDFSKSKEPVKVKISSQVQGGLVASYKGIKGFIPASQVIKEVNEDLENFVNRTLEVVVLQADRRRRKVIYSHKLAESRVQRESQAKVIEELEVGEVKEGVVTSTKDFGVFVDIGGIEGLVHISELSWSRVSHPTDIVQIGDKVKVFVLGIDKSNSRVSLGMKQLQKDPWVVVAEKYTMGQRIVGEISRIVPFGAFIKIEHGLEGLIHISELSTKHIEKVEDVVSVGSEVEATIIKLVPEEQKIGLSLKQQNQQEEVSAQTQEETIVTEENTETPDEPTE